MRAHQLDENNVIIGTIEVSDLNFMPGLVDASVGGTLGDKIINDVVTKAGDAQPIEEFEAAREKYLDQVREQREKVLVRLAGYGTQLMLVEPPDNPEEKTLCQTVMQALLDITSIPAVTAATTMGALKAAVQDEYEAIAELASEPMRKAFHKIDL